MLSAMKHIIKKIILLRRLSVLLLALSLWPSVVSYSQSSAAPVPYGALPSAAQLAWHEMELYGFVHFTINTFTGKEWGYGDEDPALFNPSAFDANKIVKDFKAAGMTGLILTAKHHDGFCLWPTKTTGHNITKSPWKNGKEDVVREFADACRKQGLKFGVYLSPWDRNHPQYGTPEYVNVYREQYKELLTQYGPVFETWHDGANGGDGYYGGAREARKIDRTTYYNWDSTWAMERQWQPGAVIMSDVGPDVRWVGTEQGYALDPCWHTYSPQGDIAGKNPAPGQVKSEQGLHGHRNGKYWIPAEVDFSIRPGWFYHAHEDDKVKTAQQLLNHYFLSVGRGASMLLNVPPDKRGLVHETDRASLKDFGKLLKQMFAVNHAKGAFITASNTRGNDRRFAVANLLDNDRYSYWATDDGVTTAELTLNLKGKKTFNVIRLRENIQLGQRIDDWAVDVWENNAWKEYAKGTAIGSSRLVRGSYVTTDKVRIRITKSPVSPCLSEVSLFTEPLQLSAPEISRDREGMVKITTPSPVHFIRYTTDGSEPTMQSPLYSAPFAMPKGGTVKAKSFGAKKEKSETTTAALGIAKSKWKIVAASFEGSGSRAAFAIDEDRQTMWHTWKEKESKAAPQEIAVDMGEAVRIAAFTYLPRQDKREWGLVNKYSFYTSEDGKEWKLAAAGELANIKANPVETRVNLSAPVLARYFKLVAESTVPASDGQSYVAVAELGVFEL